MRKFRISRLTVQDFGPVKSADIHVGDLTVLMGPQSSGKTYLAVLIHGLQRAIPQSVHFALFSGVTETLREAGIIGLVPKETLESKLAELNGSVVARLHELLTRQLSGLFSSLLRSNFEFASPGDLIRDGAKSASIAVEFSVGKRRVGQFSFTFGRDGEPAVAARIEQQWIQELGSSFENLVIVGSGGASGQGPWPFAIGSNFVPAERVLLLPVFSQFLNLILALYRNVLIPGNVPGMIGQPAPELRQTLFDYLQDVNGVLNVAGDILLPISGTLKVRNRTVVYADTKRSVDLPLARASSGVAQLAGLYLISERTGDNLLVIEEPEINLHLDAQLPVGDYLASIPMTKGRPVVMTTHSQHLVERLVLHWAREPSLDLQVYLLDENDIGRPLALDRDSREFELPPTIERALEEVTEEQDPPVG